MIEKLFSRKVIYNLTIHLNIPSCCEKISPLLHARAIAQDHKLHLRKSEL